jgi:hypothetical protein
MQAKLGRFASRECRVLFEIEFVFSPPSARVSAWRGGVGGGGSIGKFADSGIRCTTPHP